MLCIEAIKYLPPCMIYQKWVELEYEKIVRPGIVPDTWLEKEQMLEFWNYFYIICYTQLYL